MTNMPSWFLTHSCTSGKSLLNLQENGLLGSGTKWESSMSTCMVKTSETVPGQGAQHRGEGRTGGSHCFTLKVLKRYQPSPKEKEAHTNVRPSAKGTWMSWQLTGLSLGRTGDTRVSSTLKRCFIGFCIPWNTRSPGLSLPHPMGLFNPVQG